MRAARVHQYGPPEVVIVEDVPDPMAARGEVVVSVTAAAINFPDVLILANRYQIAAPLPFTPGSEFAGTVVAVGDDVEGVRPGDAVMGGVLVGAFAERVAAPASSLVPVPEGMDLASAAAFRVTYRTAYNALRSLGEAAPGDWVVVLGAAGGVGSAVVDVAKRLGCRVVAAAGSAGKLGACREQGADEGVDYAHEDLKTRIKELTGGGADVVIDPVGGPHAEQALRAMRWGGRFVTVGYASGEIPRIPLNLVMLKGVVVKGFEVRTFAMYAPDAARRDDVELQALVADGLRPRVSAVYPLEDVAVALRAVADRRTTGKVVIDVSGTTQAGHAETGAQDGDSPG